MLIVKGEIRREKNKNGIPKLDLLHIKAITKQIM